MRTSCVLAGLWLGALASVGCSDSGGGGPTCVSGEQVLCPCADGSSGVQVCTADGFGPCQCGDVPNPSGSSGEGSSSGSGSTSEAPPPTTGEPPSTCGNGVEDPGECPVACPQDCASATSTGEPACVAFAGLVENVPSVWQEGATMGFEAGGLKCASIGADHVCDYGEMLTADEGGVLETLGVGTSIWLHRETPAMQGGTTYPADLGGRCANWTYGANELADGEFVEVTAEGVVFHFDDDPFYDGIDTSHAAPDSLPCGEVLRAIPCCNAACE